MSQICLLPYKKNNYSLRRGTEQITDHPCNFRCGPVFETWPPKVSGN